MNTVQQEKETTTTGDERESGRLFTTPRMEIYETEQSFVLEAEMPGVAKDGLEIVVQGRELTLAGRRKDQEERGTPLHRESRRLNYRCVLDLDPVINIDEIRAEIVQGVAVLTLPKAERAKPRRIEVK